MENQTNVGDQNTQQIGQNSIDQTILTPEKPKINHWMILTIVFMMLFLVAVSVILLTQIKKGKTDIPKLISQPAVTQTVVSKSMLAYKDLKGNLVVTNMADGSIQTIPTEECKDVRDRQIWGTGYHWTSDGENLIISCNSGSWFEYNVSTKELKVLGINGNDIVGDNIELQLSKDDSGVFVSNEQKTRQINLVSGKVTDLFAEKALWFSPDGTKAVTVHSEKYYIFNLLTKNETEIIPPSNAKELNGYLFDFNFSSDGNTLAYAYVTNVLQNESNPGVGTRRHIAFYDLSLKQSREINLPVSGARNPVFSPDGQYIYFQAEDPYDLKVHQSLWVMKVSDGSTKKLSEAADFYYSPSIPSWSGNSIYIATNTVSKQEIHIIDIISGETKILTGNFPVFSSLRADIK